MGGGGSALCGPGHRYVVRVRRSRLGRNLFRSHGRALSPKGDDPVSGSPLKIMVDANVWVDSFCVDHAESLAARAFIGQATETGALLFFPVHIAKDVLYVVQHELKRSVLANGGALDEASARAIGDAALAFVRNMTENATAVGADASDLWLADKYLSASSRLRGQLGTRCVQARAGRLLGDQRSQAARICRSCSKDATPNDANSCFGRTRRRGYRLTRTVCGPLGRRCARGPASAIYKSSALMAGLSASCSAAFSSEQSSAARLR